MKKLTLLITVFLITVMVKAQVTPPDIVGDTMLCPETSGTAYVTNPVFDTYQWYFKYWFLQDDFAPIEGATEASFTYDWYNYDQALLMVVATLNGESYASDTLQIDSYAWLPIYTQYELTPGVSFDPESESFLLSQGATFTVEINNPPYDTLIQWYRNGDTIPGATSSSYDITQEGTYYATAAPSFCPNSISSTLPMVVNMVVSVAKVSNSKFTVYPNPVKDVFTIQLDQNSKFNKYSILDLTGRLMQHGVIASPKTEVTVYTLPKGQYIIRLEGEEVFSGRTLIVK